MPDKPAVGTVGWLKNILDRYTDDTKIVVYERGGVYDTKIVGVTSNAECDTIKITVG